MQQITLAISKGRIFEEILPLLEEMGIIPLQQPEDTRQLIIETNREDIRLVFVRASDVPTYVRHGAAELGIVGNDTLMEQGSSGLLLPLDLNIACCRMAVAAPSDFDYKCAISSRERLRIATKYVNITNTHFAAKGVPVDLIKLYGSMELAPLANLADVIVDLVSSGDTLRSNGLVEVEYIMPISSRLVINQAAMKLRRVEIVPLLNRFTETVRKWSTHR